MSLLVVGTLAYDSVETPSGKRDGILGGAATYFSYAASFFGPVRLMSIVGEDFRTEDRELLAQRDVDLAGLQTVEGARTFRWSGRYEGDMNVAETLDTQLNVFETYKPDVPDAFVDSSFVFLANSPPAMQAHVLDQMGGAFTALDTMNLWIDIANEELGAVLRRIRLLILNDMEAKMLAGEESLIRAGRAILEMGPEMVIVKKGEHGAFLFSREFFYAIPSYPVEQVVDPTGAGDSFAGGVMGYLAQAGEVNEANMKRAMLYGSVVASFNVQDFSLQRLQEIDRSDIESRFEELLRFTAHP